MPPKRAPRIPAPGAERIIITGIMAASDSYDRVRIMILDEGKNNYPDPSAARLRKCAPPDCALTTCEVSAKTTCGFSNVPYNLRDEPTLPASADGVRGTCWMVLPKNHKAHWLATAAELRGRWVRAEALVRRFTFELEDGGRRAGVSLDLAMLAELPSD